MPMLKAINYSRNYHLITMNDSQLLLFELPPPSIKVKPVEKKPVKYKRQQKVKLQLEFFFMVKEGRKKKVIPNYEAVYQIIKEKGPITVKDLRTLTGIPANTIMGVVDTLSLRYPIYELDDGRIKVLEEEDYYASPREAFIKEIQSGTH